MRAAIKEIARSDLSLGAYLAPSATVQQVSEHLSISIYDTRLLLDLASECGELTKVSGRPVKYVVK
jgi:hypothetical protein